MPGTGIPSDEFIVAATHAAFATFKFKVADGTFTVLASIALVNSDSQEYKLLSIATGTKCLPLERLSRAGDSLHDGHAEVLARRGAVCWFLEEIARSTKSPSTWIRPVDNGKWALRSGIRLVMYVSMLPCGDASMQHLAAQQDRQTAERMSSAEFASLPTGVASRGRVDFSRLGVLRTKPGRVDSPPTACMSCSDKIAMWSVCGIQGALGASLLQPIYIDAIVIGDVAPEHRKSAMTACLRAFARRLEGMGPLPPGYEPHALQIAFAELQFIFSRTATGASSSSHESLCWVAEATPKPEVLVDGIRRGLTPKQRLLPKTRPILSKSSIFQLWISLKLPIANSVTYAEAKSLSTEYQLAKSAVRGPGRPFVGWKRNNASSELEQFSADS